MTWEKIRQISAAPDINNTILLHRSKEFKETSINYNNNDDDDENNDNNINNSNNINYDNISLKSTTVTDKLSDIFETVLPSFNFNNVDLQQQQQ